MATPNGFAQSGTGPALGSASQTAQAKAVRCQGRKRKRCPGRQPPSPSPLIQPWDAAVVPGGGRCGWSPASVGEVGAQPGGRGGRQQLPKTSHPGPGSCSGKSWEAWRSTHRGLGPGPLQEAVPPQAHPPHQAPRPKGLGPQSARCSCPTFPSMACSGCRQGPPSCQNYPGAPRR